MRSLIRKLITTFLVVLSFWLGYKAHAAWQEDKCLDLGGRLGEAGVCEGVNS